MYRWAAIGALFLQSALRADPQQPPETTPESLVLKSTTHAVQLDVFVADPSGSPVQGLQKNDFAVADNGRSRDIRIFAGGIDANQTEPLSATTPAGVYSNRLGMRDARIVTAIVLDAVPRPEGLQNDPGIFRMRARPGFDLALARAGVIDAINRMEPAQAVAIYAACPDLRVVQDYTSDPDRLVASLAAFVVPPLPRSAGKKPPQTIDALVPPMLAALRDVVARMSGASGRKSVVWISQAYGADLNPQAISAATDSAVAAFNDANVPLYAVDTHFNPTCEDPSKFGDGPRAGQIGIVNLTCSQPTGISDEWMHYLARATGGRAFSGGKVFALREYDTEGKYTRGEYGIQRDGGSLVSDALRVAVDESRSAYELGFYVPESELDGKVHTLSVTVPAHPKFGLRYRSGYTASTGATAPPAAQLTGPDFHQEPASRLSPDEVGIDAGIDRAPGTTKELRVSLAFPSETVTRTADGTILLDATFIQTNASGKQLARIQETLRVPSPETQTGMVPYSRAMKLTNGAILLHIRVRDQATNRVGSIAVPIEKQ